MSFALVALLVVGGTMAWFTDSAEVTNKFTAGTVEIELHDKTLNNSEEVNFPANGFENVNPGDLYDKLVSVENIGSKRVYVRVKLTPTWTFTNDSTSNDLAPAQLVGLNTTDWIEDEDGWYYYVEILDKDEVTTRLIEGVHFIGEEMNNDYQGAKFELKVEAEAVQASHYAFRDEWNKPGLDVPALGVEKWIE